MKLVIITGITGKLGAEYLKNFQFKKRYKCLALIRNKSIELGKNVDYHFANLLNQEEVEKSLSNLNIVPYDEIIFIHPIGMFKFERYGIPLLDKDKDGIDDEIFASNVKTFLNVFNILKDKIKKQNSKVKLTVFAFGSITHNYNIPFWQSYTKSKQYLKKIIKENIEEKSIKIKCIFVNVSTVDTGNERNLRPNADRRYWLTTKEIVKISLKYLNKESNKWMEVSVYKNHPKFDPTWYTNHENVLKRWQEQMGINGST